MKQEEKKKTLPTAADRERLARAWSDRLPDEDSEESGPVRETYRDGSLISECWDHRSADGD